MQKLVSLTVVLAIVATLARGTWDWTYIILGIGIGSLIGAVAALRVKMTAMPEMVALLNGLGGAGKRLAVLGRRRCVKRLTQVTAEDARGRFACGYPSTRR